MLIPETQLNQENIKMFRGYNMPNMKFAIIGKGLIFEKHAQAIREIKGEIVDIADKSQGEDAWKNMVRETEADCLVILAPNNLHFEMTKFSAEQGKIVLCEKPLTLKSEEAKILAKYKNIFTVCQLRYHPLSKKLKSEIKKDMDYQIEMDIAVHRDKDYWESWKGQAEKSGGILFNIGIHYFDLLLYLFGKPHSVSTRLLSEKRAAGIIKGENYTCNWRLSAEEPRESQHRVFKINGTPYDFSSKENLHLYVYRDLLQKRGVIPEDAMSSVELIEKIYESSKK